MQQKSTLKTELGVNLSSQESEPELLETRVQKKGSSTYQGPNDLMQNISIFQPRSFSDSNSELLFRSNQIEIIKQYNTIKTLETKIYTDFSCYFCLIYWELFMALLSVLFFIYIDITRPEIVLTVFGSVAMMLGCIFALFVKSSLDQKKQFVSFLFFSTSTCLIVLAVIICFISIQHSKNYDIDFGSSNTDLASVIANIFTIGVIPEQLMVSLALNWNARILNSFLKERDQLLLDISAKSNKA